MQSAEALVQSLGWEHERVHLINDPSIGLEAVIAIHSTALGPTLGGFRIRRYDGMAEALDDALRLSRAMTLKAAAAGLDLGGAKAVMVDRPGPREARLAAMAEEIERLGGAYITAEDVGTTTADMDVIAEFTSHVVGTSEGVARYGVPSPDTARTVYGGIRAALAALGDESGISGRRVGVLGLGKVGNHLAGLLVEAGADVVGFDPSAAVRDGCRDGVVLAASAEEVLEDELDVLAPCALGGMIDVERAKHLRCRIVCGAANNPLSGPEAGVLLARRGILYVPDFLANCGGLLHADTERLGGGRDGLERALAETERRTREILTEALEARLPPATIAEERAWQRIRVAGDGAAAAEVR